LGAGLNAARGLGSCRLKRETERIQRELEQRDMEEALALVKASKGGKTVKLKVHPCTSSF